MKIALLSEIPYLNYDLKKEIAEHSSDLVLEPGTELLREGQYITTVPLVVEGLIKVITRHNDRDLLLYYIKPTESCVMSLTSSLKGEPSRIFAVTEEKTRAIGLPATKIDHWVRSYPDFNMLFYSEYNKRYSALLSTIHEILFTRLDQRILLYLKEMSEIKGIRKIKIAHHRIASELGTSREVVSRIVKKLESEGRLKQHQNSIEIL